MTAQLLVDLKCIYSNAKLIKSFTKRKLIAVLKANSYGHGIVPISQSVEEVADFFAVANVDEALIIRSVSNKPILILAPVFSSEELRICYESNFHITISNFSSLNFALNFARKEKKPLKVHLKFDTGMNRLGFKARDFLDNPSSLIDKIKNPKLLEVRGVYTHFPFPENTSFSLKQIDIFKSVLEKLNFTSPNVLIHAANSMATLNFPEAHFDAVRVGFLLYGVPPSKKWLQKFKKLGLKRASSLKAQIIEVKPLARGEGVSYDLTWKAPINSKVAVLEIGYADGILRSLSNKGWVKLKGRECKIIGNVCMDYTCVLIPPELEVEVGEWVEVWGENNPLEEIALAAKTIPYELMTAISDRVERRYI